MHQNAKTDFDSELTLMSQQTLRLSDCINIVWKRKWWAVAIFIAVVSIITIMTFVAKPVYKATASVAIEKQYLSEHSIDSVMSGVKRTTREYYKTQYNLLKSKGLVSEVIEDLWLRKDKTALQVGSQDTAQPTSNVTDMTAWYLSHLEIEQVYGSQLINISFLSPYPEMAVHVANTHANAFISRSIQKQRQDYQQASDWINSQLEKQRLKLQESERVMLEYKEKHDLLTFNKDENIVSRKLNEINNMLIQINTKRIEKQTTYDQLQTLSVDKEELLFLPGIEQNAIINQLRSHLVDLKTQRLELDTLYGYKHPKMLDINHRIKNQEREIFDEMRRVRQAIKVELDSLAASEETINKALDEQKQIANSYGEKSIDFNELMRQRESDQHLYDDLLKKARELSVLSNTKRTNISLADKAVLPQTPISPRKAVNISISVVLGLVCGLGFAFFIEFVDKSVRTPEDVASKLGLQVMGMLPYDNELSLNRQLTSPSNEFEDRKKASKDGYYYNASNNLTCGFPVKRSRMAGQALLIESTLPGDGKSTVVAKSAVSLARGGLRVVMVDTDHQLPTLHRIFGISDSGNVGLLNTMKGIISMNLQSGDLEKCGMGDLFYLISLKNLNGQLVVKNDTQTIVADFKDGHLFHLLNRDVPAANRLGTMLLRADLITEDQLKDALERSQRTEQPLGYILVNLGYINQDQLQGPMKLQMEELLQMLFSWKHGTYEFEPGNIETHVDRKIYFHEDYTPAINRLDKRLKSHFLESEILSNIKSLGEPNLSILPAGQKNGRQVEGMVYNALLEKTLDILKQRYDVVLIDAPPLLYTGGIVKPLLHIVDGVIFVVKSGKISVKQVNEAKNILKESGINMIGTILNHVKLGKNNNGYYNNYY